MPFDYRKLLGRIKERYGKQANFAKAMGMAERTLSVKLNNKAYFSQKEITKACSLLGIEFSEIPAHFFTKKTQCA